MRHETVLCTDGTQIAFECSGSGQPLVLVGGAATSRAVHCELATQLATEFTVINYDRRSRVW
ncbi:MAG: hypothetical protein JO020_19665 [Chloroflexi bacterium]|nr:hypothetical protein [Chloroflexota bacterium]MBV9896389.1 hypothetical protein [Chloroflexota bacterium]